MSFLVTVTYSCPYKPDITLSDVIDPDDWSCTNYWDDIGDCVSSLIAFSDRKLSQIFPKTHDYSLSKVSCVNLKEDEE